MLFLIKSITRNFMLNTTMENENKRFASISIPFLILFMMKLMAQIEDICLKYTNKRNNSLLSKSTLKNSILPSILDRSMASTKPMNIYMCAGVTAFPITCHVKKTVKKMYQYKLSFSKHVF